MKTASQVLREARALIDAPEKWGKGRYESAGRFCSVGALAMAFDGHYVPEAWSYLLRAIDRPGSIEGFNDHTSTTHSDVMAAFDRAIALAEQSEAPPRKPRESDADWVARIYTEVTTDARNSDTVQHAEQK